MPRGRPKKTESAVPAKGPALYKRDENGLLQNVEYEFNNDGSINWRAMIKEEHLFPNKSWFEARGKDCPRSTEGLDDHQLLIKLGGIKELAKLRGFTNVAYTFKKCEQEHVAVTCGISFIANYETAGQEVYFEDAANATLNNTSSFATKFLETIACNRAFVRAVRNFLNVHIVGDDEIDKSNLPAPSSSSIAPLTPNALLEKEFSDFEGFKTKLRTLWANKSYQNADAAKWKVFKDIPPKEARLLIKLVKQ
jgi:hypothetical protein